MLLEIGHGVLGGSLSDLFPVLVYPGQQVVREGQST
jgi:hypothetical protein